MQQEVKRLQAQLEMFKQEEKLLLANQNLSGKDQAISVAKLREAADLFRHRLQEIELKQQIRKGQQQLSALKALQETYTKEDKPTAKNIIKLNADKPRNVKLQLRYLVTGAGRYPAYDVRVEEVGKPLLLQYKARVFQQTGEDWSNVQVKLSIESPVTNNNRPELEPVKINFSELVRRVPNSTAPISQLSGQLRNAETQEPLSGVSVRVVGTSVGTVTDMDGRYALSIPKNNQLLQFSLIGYRMLEIPVTGAMMNVHLQPVVETLSEVVVTGYGVEGNLQARTAGVKVSGAPGRAKEYQDA